MSLSRIGCSAMFVIAFALFAPSESRAATEQPGVARVSVLRGAVDIEHADSGDTTAATINAPLGVGDYLVTHDDARAEVEFGYATALRLASSTSLRFVTLDGEHRRVQLASGTVELRLARSLRANAEIETPQATVRATERGRIRIAVARDGATTVTVRSGRADVVTDSGTQHVDAGATLAIGPGDASLRTVVAASDDEFDRWNDARDRAVSHFDDAYVDDGMVGAGDLDAYGRWIDNSRYGRVWSPYEGAGWAPYHDGRFAYEPYYGWTWVAAEPWGWAPYHYGNWFYAANSGWCWYPGAYAFDRPFVYRPAIVAFFSFGGSGSSFGFGNIGWVPLAPYEPFAPWYGNVTNVTVINNTSNVTVVNAPPASANGRVFTIYHNARAPGGAVALDRRSFANGNFVKLQTVTQATVVRAAPVFGVLPIVPTHVVPHATLPTGTAIRGAVPITTMVARPELSRPYRTHPVERPVIIDSMESRRAIVHPVTIGPAVTRRLPIEIVRPLNVRPLEVRSLEVTRPPGRATIVVPVVRPPYATSHLAPVSESVQIQSPRIERLRNDRPQTQSGREASSVGGPARTFVMPRAGAVVRSATTSEHSSRATTVTSGENRRPE